MLATHLARGVIVLSLIIGFALGQVALAQPRAPDNLDALLGAPPITGMAPGAVAWNADGSVLAFAWNDAGGSYRDVWLWQAGSAAPQRLTQHAADGAAGGGVSELAWLGDGRVAYVREGTLWSVDTTGTAGLLDGTVPHIRNLQVSPDGRTIAFTSGGPVTRYLHEFVSDGSLWTRDAAAGAAVASHRRFGGDDPKVFVESFEWSQDGQRIALVQADNRAVPVRQIHYYANGGEHQRDDVSRSFPGDETTRRRLGVLDTDGGEVRWLALADEMYPIWNYALSADGTRVFANTSDFVAKRHTVYVFDVANGTREVFYEREDLGNVVPGWRVAWAPDDEGLVILTDRDGHYHLYHQANAGAQPRALTQGPWEIFAFEVDAGGAMIYFVANTSHLSERQLYRVPFGGGAVEQLTQTPGTWSPAFAPDFSAVALHFSNDTTPTDLYARTLGAAADVVRVTTSPRAEFADYVWADVRYPEFESHKDGARIYGRLAVPPDFDPSRKYPLVVGSVYSDTVNNQWARDTRPNWAFDQHLVARGYLVLKVNVRGSRGQGRAFSGGLIRDYGGIDTDDIESAVRGLIAEGIVDPERVAIWGNSYGGLMTLMSLFKKPGLYAAGIAGAPATNVWHAYPGQMWVMGERSGDDYPARYERQSALFQSEGLADPLMIVHGSADPIVLYADSIALVERMISQGKAFELVTLPGASHGWMADNLAQTRFIYRKMIDFFDRHLGMAP